MIVFEVTNISSSKTFSFLNYVLYSNDIKGLPHHHHSLVSVCKLFLIPVTNLHINRKHVFYFICLIAFRLTEELNDIFELSNFFNVFFGAIQICALGFCLTVRDKYYGEILFY